MNNLPLIRTKTTASENSKCGVNKSSIAAGQSFGQQVPRCLAPQFHKCHVVCGVCCLLMAATSSGYVATTGNNVSLFDKLMDTLAFSPPVPAFDIFNVTSSTVAVVTTARPSPTQISPAVSAEPTEDYVVLPGPEDVLLFNSSNGLYQQSVTLTARMYPIEATAAKSIWGLPTLIWGILIGTIVILIVILATLFFCCWLQPRTRKLLSASYYTTTGSNVSHSSIVPKSQTSDSNQLVMPLSIGICPPQYSAPPPPGSSNNNSGTNQQQHQQQQLCSAGSSTGGIPCHGSNASPAAVHHGTNKYVSSPHQQQYAHQQQQQQQYHQQQYQHHHQCIHHQQQQQQQYQAHYAHLQQQQHQQQQQSYQQYYNQQQQQHQQQQQQQLTQYIHPAQQQALQQQQQQKREHQIQQQQHHYHHHQQQQQKQQQKQQSQLVHHKSMWAINPLYASSGVISDGTSGGGGGGGPDGRGDADEEAGSTSYRTRSLPSWGKNKQRPLSNADDLEELYAKVNFSKKRRNRMRNDEAAIIALCRSRSQNLASLPMADQDAVVVYDERTAL